MFGDNFTDASLSGQKPDCKGSGYGMAEGIPRRESMAFTRTFKRLRKRMKTMSSEAKAP